MAKKPFVLQVAIFSALRRLFRRWPAFAEVRNRAKEEYFVKTKNGKSVRRVRFVCEICNKKADAKNIAVDHIEPVVPLEGLPFINGSIDLNVYVSRLFCDIGNLQLLCKHCHNEKTKAENKARRSSKNKDNKKTIKNSTKTKKTVKKLK